MINSVFKYINSDQFEINVTEGKLHILNYFKILDLSNKLIKVKLSNKIINVCGDGLCIKKLDEKELYIIGNIKGIDFIDE